MNKSMDLKVHSEMMQNGEKDQIDFFTEGKFYKKNNKYYLKYDEGQVTGMEDTKTIIVIEDDKVTINRYGKNRSKMVFILGEKTYTTYETAYGVFKMEIFTNILLIDLEKNNIEIKYDLLIHGLSNGWNHLKINF